MFDAVNSIERRYRPYLVQLPAAAMASKRPPPPRHAVLVGLYPREAELKDALAAYLATIPEATRNRTGSSSARR